MSTYEEIVTKLRGFLEVNGEGPPTEEQWEKIKTILKGEVVRNPADDAMIKDLEDLLKDFKKEGGKIPAPPSPYGPPMYPAYPNPSPGDVHKPGTGNPPPYMPTPIWYCGPEVDGTMYSVNVDEHTGAITMEYSGDALNNGFDTVELPETEIIDPVEVGPKILETEAVKFQYRKEGPPDDRHDDSSG